MKITFRLTLMGTLVALVFATVAVVGVSSYLNSRFMARTLSSQVLDQTGARIALRIQALLDKAASLCDVNRNLIRSGQLDPKDFTRLTRHFYETIREHPELSYLSFGLEASGEYCHAWRKPDGNLWLQERRRNTQGDIERREFAPAGRGRNLALFKIDNSYDPRKRPFYQTAKKSGKQVWPPAYVFIQDPFPAVPGITCATPVYRRPGQLLGVATADFDLYALTKFLAKIRIGRGGFAFVIEQRPDGSRRVIAHPDPKLLVRKVQKDGKSAFDLVRAERIADPHVKAFVRRLPAPAETKDLSGLRRFRFAQGGVTYLAAYRRLGGRHDVDWLICMVVPEADLMGKVHQANRNTVITGLVAFAIAILLSILLATRISRPLKQVVGEAEEIGLFRLEPKTATRSTLKEIDQLLVAMEDMKTGLRSFGKYVPTEVVRALLASGQEARLGGKRRELTVFFSDIAGFTSISERLAPEELVALLGEYLEDMSGIVQQLGGTVDKYIGDAVMAFWGAPNEDARHGIRACRAALASQERLAELRRRWAAEGRPEIRARIGIDTGELIVGNMGAASRLNYTVVGDHVNLASRLEGLNKHYGTEIMISEQTLEQVAGLVVVRPLDRVAVKGKTHGVVIYELLGLDGQVDPAIERRAARHTEAVDAYFERRWDEAIELLEEASGEDADDTPTRLILERARKYREAPPPEDWDGTFHMKSK